MFVQTYLCPMRIISRPKLTGFGDHWGLQTIWGDVIHLAPGGVRRDSLEGFLQGRPLTEVYKVPQEHYDDVFLRIEAALRSPIQYRLGDQNCQTFANVLAGRKAESPQVQGVVVLSLLALFLRFA